jgi:hypothetical protein
MMHPLSRLEGENTDFYRVFLIWKDLPRKRRAASKFSVFLQEAHGIEYSPHTINTIRAQHRWHDRLKAYLSWQAKRKADATIRKLVKEETALACQQLAVRHESLEKSRRLLKRIDPDSIDASDMRQVCGFFDATRKAMETMGIGVLDHADQLRRLSAQVRSGSGTQPSETTEELPPIPPESGCIQHGDSEAETVLEPSTGDSEGVG